MFLPIGDDIEREAAPFPFLTMLFVFGCFAAFGWEISLPPETAWDQIIPFTMIPAVVFGYVPLLWLPGWGAGLALLCGAAALLLLLMLLGKRAPEPGAELATGGIVQ